jgi:c-di-AMP phosphodiesterase-like protein
MEDNSTFFYISLILLIMTVIQGNYIASLIGVALILGAIRISSKKHEDRKKQLNQYLIEFTNNIDVMSRQALLNFPIPLAIINEAGNIHWYNSKFREAMESGKSHKDNIKDFIPGFPLKNLKENGESASFDIQNGTKNFNIIYNRVEDHDKESSVYLLFLIDNTRFTSLKEIYSAEKSLVALVEIDNFDEISKKMDRVDRSSLMARIEKELNTFAQRMNGFAIKYLDDRFILLFENRFLENLETKKFDILESVKLIRTEKDEFFTLSVGVGVNAKSLNQQFEFAKGALSIALGRGGDQAVVKSAGKVSYYGGRSKAVEKSSKVKARMIANAIRQIIAQSSNVIITGHKSGDIDSFGASLGIYAIAKAMNKEAYIVLNDINAALRNVYERMLKEEGNYSQIIVNSENALKLVNENTLGVMVDTHKPSYTEGEAVLDKIDKIILIDHHRRGEEYLEDPVLDYLEPYASSTCELIAELFQYMNEQIVLTKFEADAMLSGIIMDTNAFTYKTGVRTFEVASYLKRAGADTVDAKRLLSDDIDTWKRKSEVIERAEILYGNIALSIIDEVLDTGLIIASQSASDLLSVKGVQASFVLVRRENHIHISGRSIGSINVQVILEQLGGGGHLELAGAQVETQDMEEAKKLLIVEIEKYRKENNII